MHSLKLSSEQLASIRCQAPVLGLTHGFYKYPARFSPQLARTLIERFTEPGDVVLDPFCGGATSLVEAAALGRQAVGSDISTLAVFLARVKTFPLSAELRAQVRDWADASARLTLRARVVRPPRQWREMGYQRHLTCARTWPIRMSIELLLDRVECLPHPRLKDFARCAVLRVGQWALDGRRAIPTASKFRTKFSQVVQEMLNGMSEYETTCGTAHLKESKPVCLLRSADKLDCDKTLEKYWPPKLVLTSPPYPGVHVLYHRWQISGRRETPAPFWIADKLDGKGESHYTLGCRKQHDDTRYFHCLRDCFRSIRKISDQETVIAQVVGFSDPKRQLTRYTDTLSNSGFEELIPIHANDLQPRRVWRDVPSRRWYTGSGANLSSGKEVLLLHSVSKQAPTATTTVRSQIPSRRASV